jgi:uncharacterized protein YqjF (DUF2071 family)
VIAALTACLAGSPARAVEIRSFAVSEPYPFPERRALRWARATFCELNRPEEADTASQLEALPITPWPSQPLKRIAMRQTWRRLTFLHWPYAPDLIRRLIPPGLELDTFDQAAWVGLVPFEIYDSPGIPHFPETNLRTYVVGPDGSRAVWFFSLDAARILAVLGARIGYRLPYFWAKMGVSAEHGAIHYRSQRHWPHDPGALTDIVIQPGEPYEPAELTARDHFLTARFRLYASAAGRLRYAQIEHPAWPLARASVLHLRQTLFESASLTAPSEPPLALCRRIIGQDWLPE